jgi:Ulp1 family protease
MTRWVVEILDVYLYVDWRALSVLEVANARNALFDVFATLLLQLLRQYICNESMDKKKQPFDLTGWIDYSPSDIPQQRNGYDCGVFMCKFAEAVMRETAAEHEATNPHQPMSFHFSQAHMSMFRKRLVLEIVDCQPVP